MPMTSTGSARLRTAFIAMLSVVLAALVLALLPAPAHANVVCSLASQPVTLEFGRARTATGEIRYNCTNFSASAANFTICAAAGNPSFPGTVDQPRLQNGGNSLAFNVYVDPAGTVAWTRTLPIAQSVVIAPGATGSGTLTFYGRIPPGQTSPVGNYSGAFFNTVLGFLAAGSQTCLSQVDTLFGTEFSLNVTAIVAESCDLGVIEAVDFGQPAGVWTEVDAAGAVQVTCPAGTLWNLSFDGGRYTDGGERRMRSSGGDYVPYRLYSNNGRTQIIPINGIVAGTGTGAVQSSPVYGRVSVAAPPPVGTYSDTVIVVLSF